MLYNKLDVKETFGLVKAQRTSEGYNVKDVDISQFDLSNRTIVILCGNKTKSVMKAQSYAAYCFYWLNKESKMQDLTIYSLFYPKDQPLEGSLEPNLRFDYKELANIMFGKMFSNENKFTAQEVADALSKVTFFGHSMGAYVMNQLMVNLNNMMVENGFSSADIEKVYSNVAFIGYSPFALVEAPIKSVYVTPVYDSVGSIKHAFNRMKNNKNVISTNPKLNINAVDKLKGELHQDYIEKFYKLNGPRDVTYFKSGDSIFSTPGLLFDDGFKEDHNLAGIINFRKEYRTKAGKLTTDFMRSAFDYGLNVERNDSFIESLYEKAAEEHDNVDDANKEF